MRSGWSSRNASGAASRTTAPSSASSSRLRSGTATRSGIDFDVGKLTSDAAYNAKIGATHLGELVEEWKGSYILTFAAYNAGSRNVKRWIDAYGDPRSGNVDPVDWVERIPFYETRNYVQRVMENLQVYRQRLGLRTALLIESDLRRGN